MTSIVLYSRADRPRAYHRPHVFDRRPAPFRHPAGRERDQGPDHHRPRHPDPVPGDRLRRLAGLGQRPALERRLPLPRHVLLHRPRDHGRLPPPPHPPRLQDLHWLHGLLAILGSAAIEGPVISWVADHRKHHAFSDLEGDPHSPHVDHGHGWWGAHARPLPRPHGLALHPHPARQQGTLRAGPAQGPGRSAGSTAPSSTGRSAACCCPSSSAGRSAAPSSPPSPACSGAGWSASSSSITSPTASTRSATSSASANSRATINRATWR